MLFDIFFRDRINSYAVSQNLLRTHSHVFSSYFIFCIYLFLYYYHLLFILFYFLLPFFLHALPLSLFSLSKDLQLTLLIFCWLSMDLWLITHTWRVEFHERKWGLKKMRVRKIINGKHWAYYRFDLVQILLYISTWV